MPNSPMRMPLTKNFQYVAFRDENVRGWKSRHGKKIQSTAIGGIIRDLKNKSHTPLLVNRFFPSTKTCSGCSSKQTVELWERTYICKNCGLKLSRDWNAAINIEQEGLKQLKVPTECRDIKPRERATSAVDLVNHLRMIPGVHCKLFSANEEAARSLA